MIMLDFRIAGFDLLPDFIGYIIFFNSLGYLVSQSEFFDKAKNLSIAMIVFSLFTFYQKTNNMGNNYNFGNPVIFVIGLIALIVDLILVYNIFQGINQMASVQNKDYLINESDECWRYYLILCFLPLIAIILMFIPVVLVLFLICLIAFAIYVIYKIFKFMGKCSEELSMY
ncbi:hypothetical protein [Fervidicella metallireducens]|nr:hypothetical protein [Fervidicella metallireducens]